MRRELHTKTRTSLRPVLCSSRSQRAKKSTFNTIGIDGTIMHQLFYSIQNLDYVYIKHSFTRTSANYGKIGILYDPLVGTSGT